MKPRFTVMRKNGRGGASAAAVTDANDPLARQKDRRTMSFVSALLLLYVTFTYWRIIISVLGTIDIATCSTTVNNFVNFYAE